MSSNKKQLTTEIETTDELPTITLMEFRDTTSDITIKLLKQGITYAITSTTASAVYTMTVSNEYQKIVKYYADYIKNYVDSTLTTVIGLESN